MIVGEGNHTYEWIDRWATIPMTPTGAKNGRTHGVVVSASGNVIVFHQANPAVLVYDRHGRLLDAWGERFPGAHGLNLVTERGVEFLWLTDEHSGEVVKTTLDGEFVQSLQKPALKIYEQGRYSPTWVAVNEKRFGGSGDIWVADGYGMSVIHRYDASGEYLQTLTGEEGDGGRFNCPHGITFDFREGEPELLVADRGNKRFQVFGADGSFLGTFGHAFLSCPCVALAVENDLLVPELNARIAVLDKQNALVCILGDNEQVCNIDGWPNHPPKLIQPGKFNSPHSIAADNEGNLYVVEWIVGGRITKLVKQNHP